MTRVNVQYPRESGARKGGCLSANESMRTKPALYVCWSFNYVLAAKCPYFGALYAILPPKADSEKWEIFIINILVPYTLYILRVEF